jgi:hypothetical protein
MEGLGMQWDSAKFVPKFLTNDLNQWVNSNENILKNVITSDKTWI